MASNNEVEKSRLFGRAGRALAATLSVALIALGVVGADAPTPVAAATLPCAANLLTGGDFGTLTGTTTQPLVPAPTGYAYNGGSLSAAGSYAVMSWNSSVQAHPSTALWDGLAGHTTGNNDDAYVGVNGSTAQAVFFSRTVTDLLSGVTYDAGVWATNATQALTAQSAATLPDFGVRIRRTDTNAIVAQADTGPLPSHIGTPGTRMGPSAWTQTTATFVTDPNPAVDYVVEFYNISRQSSGNDFAFDDLSLNAKVCPGMTVDKQAVIHDSNTDGLSDAGDTIDYSVVVTNTGDSQLTSLTLTDPMLSSAGITLTCPTTTLAAGASTTCTASGPYTVTAADAASGSVDNTAQASATTADARTLTDSDTVSTAVQEARSGLSLVKSASPLDPASYVVGQQITYSFLVTNTGNIPLANVTPQESAFTGSGSLSAIQCPAGAAQLAPAAQVTCTATYTLTQADIDAGSVTNSATATATPPGGATPPPTSPPSTKTIPSAQTPAITLVKSADSSNASKAGDPIAYSFLVTNSGNVTLTNPTVTETSFSGTGTAPIPTCPTGTLVPGAQLTCTASYTLTQADVDAGTVTNVATATATPTTGVTPVSGFSSATVTIAAAPALTLAKTATPTTVGTAGDTVTFSFLATNTGNVTLTALGITEGAFSGTGTLGSVVCPAGAASVAPGASVTCTAAYTVTQADIDAGKVTNTATATATPPGSATPPVSAPSQATVTVAATPAITLVKSATPTTVSAAGDLVNYSFLVTNTGPVTLTAPAITETAFSGTGAVPVVVCPTGAIAPATSVTCTANYTATQADINAGTITNTATATATPPAGFTAPVSAASTATVTVPVTPALTLQKTADLATITKAGQTVNYSFVVTNSGNVTLSNIAVSEDTFSGSGTLPAVTCPQPSLAVGASETCTTSYTVTQADVDSGSLTNTATATGTPPASTTPVSSAQSSVTIPVQQTATIALVKSASPAAPADFQAGETITYSFVVTNTGNVTMSDITIDEGAFTGSGTLPAATCPAGAALLAPGAQVVCTTSYTVSQADIDAGSVTNTATALGTPPGSIVTVPSDPFTVTVPEPAKPAATVVKTADTTKITQAGQVIHYSFTVTNTGNTSVGSTKVNEGAFTGHGTLGAVVCPTTPATLLPGQTIVCTASYTVVAADLTGQKLSNTAIVSVTPPGGTPITSDPSTAEVASVLPPAAVAKPIGLASTGSTVGWGVGVAALVLLLAGSVLLLIRRRRATE